MKKLIVLVLSFSILGIVQAAPATNHVITTDGNITENSAHTEFKNLVMATTQREISHDQLNLLHQLQGLVKEGAFSELATLNNQQALTKEQKGVLAQISLLISKLDVDDLKDRFQALIERLEKLNPKLKNSGAFKAYTIDFGWF